MSKNPFGSTLPTIGYACFVAALFLFVRGYTFNTNDQAEHLPQIYQMLDWELYPNDYFVNASNSIFTVRHYYEQLVLFVAKTIELEWGLFILTFLCIALMAFSIARMAEILFKDKWAAILAPILAMFVFYNFSVGGNHIMYGSFISSTIAKGIAAIGLLQFVKRRVLIAGLFLGLSTLFQPLVGLQLFLVLSGFTLLVRRKMSSTIRFSVGYMVVALLILIPVFYRQFAEGIEYDKDLFYELLYRFRNHHHYLPSLFPVTHYIKFAGVLILGLMSYIFLKPQDRGLYPAVIGFGLFGMLVYWIGLEHLGVHQLGKTQWFKTTVWIQTFSSIMIAGFVGQNISGFLPMRFYRRLFPLVVSIGAMILLFGISNSKYLPEVHQDKFMVGNRTYSDLEQMHFWIEKNTEKNVSVLVAPDNNAFPCQAKRSIPIHYQAIIHEPFFMLEWYEDYLEIYGVSIENLEGIDARKHAADLFQSRNYRGSQKQINYRLDNLETCQFSDELGTVVHQQGNWVLTEFLPLNPS